MKLYVAEIEKSLETGIIKPILRKKISIFLAAINDWPDLILSFEDYELAIRKYLDCNTTKELITSSLAKPDLSKEAWKAESLATLLEIFRFYEDGISLKEIIEELKDKLFY